MFVLSRMCNLITNHPEIGEIVSTVINIIKIAVPIILIVMGMLDLAKAAAAGKPDDMAKGRRIFFSRCITGVLVFFVIAIVQLAIGLVAYATGDSDSNNSSIWSCVDSIING